MGVAGAVLALGIGHLLEDGARLRPGQAINSDTCRTWLLLCTDTTTDSAGIPHLVTAARIL